MDRLSRKELKTDKFAEEVFDIFAWSSHHKDKVLRYAALAGVVIVLGAAWFVYSRYQAGARQEALAQAMRVNDATVGTETVPAALHYETQVLKDTARDKAYTDIATKYSGSDEGAIAAMVLASDAASKGNLADSEKRYKDIVDNAPKAYAALARLALSQVYMAEGKTSDAQKVLQEAVDSPADTVSKEQATIALARVVAKNNPQEALKMLDKLRSAPRTAVSGAAAAAYGEVNTAKK